MFERPFRFVHASDLHLERPLGGVAEVPDHLREAFLAAPLTAARKLFDHVLATNADFLVLSGDVVDIDIAGPRAALFLTEQFERLAAQGVPVYWAGGTIDSPDRWPVGLVLPSNVHRFSAARPEEYRYTNSSRTVAHLSGWSQPKKHVRAGDFWPDADGTFSIAVTRGDADRESLANRGIHYWALGGRHERATLGSVAPIIHYPGTTQGRTPAETGAHGCTLVDVDPVGPPRLTMLATDVVRFQQQRLVIDDGLTRERLVQSMHARLDELRAVQPGVDLIVSWSIAGTGPLVRQLSRGTLAGEILTTLRAEYGHRTTWSWSSRLDVEPVAPAQAFVEEDTLRGEFLRTFDELLNEDGTEIEALHLETLLNESQSASLAATVRLDHEHARRRVLARAAALGADLLGGE